MSLLTSTGDPERPGKLLKASMCRKTRQKIEGSWRTIRDCAYLGQPGEGTGNEHHCLITQGTYDIYVEVCTCNSKDGCNSAPNMKSNFNYIFLFTVPIIFILVKLNYQ